MSELSDIERAIDTLAEQVWKVGEILEDKLTDIIIVLKKGFKVGQFP